MRHAFRALISLVFLGVIVTAGAAEGSVTVTNTGSETRGAYAALPTQPRPADAPRLDCSRKERHTIVLGVMTGSPTLRAAMHFLGPAERVHLKWRQGREAVAVIDRAQRPSPERLHLYRFHGEWFIDLLTTCTRRR